MSIALEPARPFEPIRRSEAERLDALQAYDILDTPPEPEFDRITRLVTRIFDVPISTVTLVDADRQWFKSMQGLSICETPRSESFCDHSVQANAPLIVEDAREDPRFAENPQVVGPPHIRFYIGAPLRTLKGHVLGALCAIDSTPRKASARDIAILTDLADMVVEQIELRQTAAVDGLTGALRRSSFIDSAATAMRQTRARNEALSCLLLDADHFKRINDTRGHAAGDAVLQAIVESCRSVLRSSDIIGRLGGEEFCIMLPGADERRALGVAQRLQHAIAALPATQGHGVTVSIGISSAGPAHGDLSALISAADCALYAAKGRGRNCTVVSGRDDLSG
ncbi:diguanylate cyclase (GGDEF) domain-containing protein [Devosia enhydra]|uniref:Diguanylate cyclase (GGDEF) domain-containing protein n=1 Tax=Devosia enhydra TaxID=665118 RepID=A0A1K2I4A6_9HYPH|nr:sensor domain-containing diguanylate cyclase [Devosia enhydra]SFZ86564.1 diguanylate cyclase (GGDEF) domain-containing protein [Devosia enhydra]